MAIALVVLAVGSVVAGYVGLPHVLGGSNRIERFLEPSFEVLGAGAGAVQAEGSGATEALELGLMGVSSLVALGGIAIAFYFFVRNRRAADDLAGRFAGLYRLLLNKYYVDETYDATLVQPIRILSEEGLWRVVDAQFIDGTVNGVGATVAGSSQILRRIQTGSVRVYAASVFLGAVTIVGYYLWR
jgi:NADH-quinone oxidoreductase subunit L